MPFVSGFLKVRSGPGGGGEGPDNTLPGVEGPVDPGYGHPIPTPPPGIWPPPSLGNPIVPVDPGFGIPITPGTIWPSPGRPPHIDAGLPTPPSGTLPARPPVRPDAGLPQPPGSISNPIQPHTYWMLCYCPSLGWNYIAVDPSLQPGTPLPPSAQPK